MFNAEPDDAHVGAAHPKEPISNARRFRIYLAFGAYAIVGGLFLQWFLPTTTLTCQQHAAPTASCVVTERMLLGLVATGSAQVAGVRSARTVIQAGLRRSPERRSYHVVLDAADGEHPMIWSKSFEAAEALVRTINERLQAGAAFEASLGFAFWDWLLRAVGLVAIAAGATVATIGVSGLRALRNAAGPQ